MFTDIHNTNKDCGENSLGTSSIVRISISRLSQHGTVLVQRRGWKKCGNKEHLKGLNYICIKQSPLSGLWRENLRALWKSCMSCISIWRTTSENYISPSGKYLAFRELSNPQVEIYFFPYKVLPHFYTRSGRWEGWHGMSMWCGALYISFRTRESTRGCRICLAFFCFCWTNLRFLRRIAFTITFEKTASIILGRWGNVARKQRG